MEDRSLEELTEDEIRRMCTDSIESVVQLLKTHRIRAGSTATYNLYGAVQEAIRGEWDNARQRRQGGKGR